MHFSTSWTRRLSIVGDGVTSEWIAFYFYTRPILQNKKKTSFFNWIIFENICNICSRSRIICTSVAALFFTNWKRAFHWAEDGEDKTTFVQSEQSEFCIYYRFLFLKKKTIFHIPRWNCNMEFLGKCINFLSVLDVHFSGIASEIQREP